MTEDNSFKDGSVINEEYISKHNSVPGPLFYNPSSEKPPYPTDKGWVNVHGNEWIRTESFNFNNSPQFTVQFEVFPLPSNFKIKFFVIEEDPYPNQGY